MVKYLIDVEDELWNVFKLTATFNGLKVKEAVKQALIEFIQNHSINEVSVNINVIKDAKTNLYHFIIQEELRNKLVALRRAVEERRPYSYIQQLKHQILDLLKKNPVVDEELAEEVKVAFQVLKNCK